LRFDLNCEVAVIVGQGNVAIDVARMLLKSIEDLKSTDISAPGLNLLANSKINRVYLIGRRGIAQAAFTTSELRELLSLKNCETYLLKDEVIISPELEIELQKDRPKRRLIELLLKKAKIVDDESQIPQAISSKTLILRFLQTPLEIKKTKTITGVILERNSLQKNQDGTVIAKGTGQKNELKCGALFRSVGFFGVPMPDLPWNGTVGTLLNQQGKVLDTNGNPVHRVYASGWIKRGPSGIVGTNRICGEQTVAQINWDLQSGVLSKRENIHMDLPEFLKKKNVNYISFQEWKIIEKEEEERGKKVGKPREKILSVEEMLRIAHK
jgi:ferredoxin--NADP+ reductase